MNCVYIFYFILKVKRILGFASNARILYIPKIEVHEHFMQRLTKVTRQQNKHASISSFRILVLEILKTDNGMAAFQYYLSDTFELTYGKHVKCQ